MLLSVLALSWSIAAGTPAALTPATSADVQVVVSRTDGTGASVVVARSVGDKPLRLGMEPGDGIDEWTWDVRGAPGAVFRMRRTVTASVSVQNEGPTLGLVGFADKVHPARAAMPPHRGAHTFRLPAIRPEEHLAKKVTGRALIDELKRRGEHHWVEQLAVATVDGCCAAPSASASRVDVEIQRKEAAGWVTVRRVVIDVPQGC